MYVKSRLYKQRVHSNWIKNKTNPSLLLLFARRGVVARQPHYTHIRVQIIIALTRPYNMLMSFVTKQKLKIKYLLTFYA